MTPDTLPDSPPLAPQPRVPTAPHRPPMHVIVGDGVIGLAVAHELARRGLPHVLASRTPPAMPSPGADGAAAPPPTHRRIDALDAASLLQGTADATHVYLTLGLPYATKVWQRDWPVVIDNALAAARQHGFTLVFFDNVYAYGPTPLQVPMREDHPQTPTSRKGAVRKAVDDRLLRAVHDQGLRLVIGRSADFYGPGVRNSVLYQAAVERQLHGKAAQWLADPDRLHSYTYTPDAARGLVELALDDGALGQVWHLPTAQPALPTRTLLERSATLLGAPSSVQRLPRALLPLLKLVVPVLREVDEMLYQLDHDYVFSSARFSARYPGFRETSYQEGIDAMVESLRQRR